MSWKPTAAPVIAKGTTPATTAPFLVIAFAIGLAMGTLISFSIRPRSYDHIVPDRFVITQSDWSRHPRQSAWATDGKDQNPILYGDVAYKDDWPSRTRDESVVEFQNAGTGDALLHGKLSGTNGVWHLQVFDPDNKPAWIVDFSGNRLATVRITDASGQVLAEGEAKHPDVTGADASTQSAAVSLLLRAPDGYRLALLTYDPAKPKWTVTVEHPSKINTMVYGMLAGFDLVLSAPRANTEHHQ